MSTIRYTHGFNLLHQLVIGWGVVLLGGFGLTSIVIYVLEPIWESMASGLPSGIKTPIEWIACIAIWGGCVFLLFKAIVMPLSPLPTWLYLRLCLFVPATWQDAKETSFLFEGDGSGKWYPFTALRKVPRQFRREVLHEFAEQVQYGRYGIPHPRSQPTPQSPPPQKPTAAPAPSHEDPRIANARKVLGLNSQATAEEIKKAYRQLIKKYHPDVYAKSQPELQYFAHEKAKELNEAYATLNKKKNGDAGYM
jgi:hypothetical protein